MATINLSNQIKFFREDRGISVEWLAAELGVSQQEIEQWESGETYPELSLLPDIAEFFDTTTDNLLMGNGLDVMTYEGIMEHILHIADAIRSRGTLYIDEYVSEMEGYEPLKIGLKLMDFMDIGSIRSVLRLLIPADYKLLIPAIMGIELIKSGCTPSSIKEKIENAVAETEARMAAMCTDNA